VPPGRRCPTALSGEAADTSGGARIIFVGDDQFG
jgi:hypothetical protein